jgi:hypothetical protein
MEIWKVCILWETTFYRLDNADSAHANTEPRNLLQSSCIKQIFKQAIDALQDTTKRENFGVAYCDILRNLMSNRIYALKFDSDSFKSWYPFS